MGSVDSDASTVDTSKCNRIKQTHSGRNIYMNRCSIPSSRTRTSIDLSEITHEEFKLYFEWKAFTKDRKYYQVRKLDD